MSNSNHHNWQKFMTPTVHPYLSRWKDCHSGSRCTVWHVPTGLLWILQGYRWGGWGSQPCVWICFDKYLGISRKILGKFWSELVVSFLVFFAFDPVEFDGFIPCLRRWSSTDVEFPSINPSPMYHRWVASTIPKLEGTNNWRLNATGVHAFVLGAAGFLGLSGCLTRPWTTKTGSWSSEKGGGYTLL